MKAFETGPKVDAGMAGDAEAAAEAGAVPATAGDSMQLVDVMARVEPTWVEAVAVVQAVCAQLAPGRTPPNLAAIMVSTAGAVSFGPTPVVDGEAAVMAAGRLLTAILRQGDCPMPVWEATELARRSPGQFGTARAFGESLTCFPAHQGLQELAAYVASSRSVILNPARPATAVFGMGLTARALIMAVTLGGIGTGMSVGVLIATRGMAPAPPAGVAPATSPDLAVRLASR